MKLLPRFLFSTLALLLSLFCTGCPDSESGQPNRAAQVEAIKNEVPGDYWIGRRFYKVDYKFWGFLRRPGQPWSTARLVMMNEQGHLAPDRATGHLGSDNNYEYKLTGEFSDQPVYEPASDSQYPEFIFKSAELISVNPPDIYHVYGATDPTRRIIPTPR